MLNSQARLKRLKRNKKTGDADADSFAQRPFYQKLFVLSGGILFNLLFAYMAVFIIFMLGIQKTPYLYPLNASNAVEIVVKNSTMEKIGLQVGDRILSLNNLANLSPQEFIKKIIDIPTGATFTLTVERNATQHILKGIREEFLGFQLQTKEVPPTKIVESAKNCVEVVNFYISSTFNSLKKLIQRGNVGSMTGPITIVSEAAKKSSLGFKTMLLFMALVSVNLAVLNLIPLPILDGGQIVFYSLEAFFRRSLKPQIREFIFILNWVLFLALLLYISLKDIYSLFSKDQ